MSKPDGGPAFPELDPRWSGSGGMTLRDYFAAQALTNLITAHERNYPPHAAYAEWAYQIADAMLAERAK